MTTSKDRGKQSIFWTGCLTPRRDSRESIIHSPVSKVVVVVVVVIVVSDCQFFRIIHDPQYDLENINNKIN